MKLSTSLKKNLFIALSFFAACFSKADAVFADPSPEYIQTHAHEAYGRIKGDMQNLLLTKKIFLIGEIHGTNELPRFVSDLAEALVEKEQMVTVALEIPSNYQRHIDEAAMLRDPEILASTPFFRFPFQDGRSSMAMATLIATLGDRVSFLAFDRSESANIKTRDLKMAQNLISYAELHPQQKIIVLAGNLHTRIEKGNPFDPNFESMGYHLLHSEDSPFNESNTLSVIGRYGEGQYWACQGHTPSECHVYQHKQEQSVYESSIAAERYLLLEPQLNDGHQSTLFVRRSTASLPLVDEWPLRQQCQYSPTQFQQFLNQEFWTFDQTFFGHRGLSLLNSGNHPQEEIVRCKLASAQLIDSYMLNHSEALQPWQSRVLYFHSGQDYAMHGLDKIAVKRFERSLNPEEQPSPPLHWNAYVAATIAFLEGNVEKIDRALQKFGENIGENDQANYQIVLRMKRCVGRANYFEAYTASGRCSD